MMHLHQHQHHRARSITATSAKQILSRRSRVVCSSSQRFNSSSQQRPDKLLPPPNALATDAPRTASSPPPPSETGSSDRSHETDYVVIGSGIGGGWGGTRQCQPLCHYGSHGMTAATATLAAAQVHVSLRQTLVLCMQACAVEHCWLAMDIR